MHSTLVQDAVLRNLQTIGQSVGRLSDTLREAHLEVNWRGIIGLRNVLVHDYLGINQERIGTLSRTTCRTYNVRWRRYCGSLVVCNRAEPKLTTALFNSGLVGAHS
jgi:hypothetical protein